MARTNTGRPSRGGRADVRGCGGAVWCAQLQLLLAGQQANWAQPIGRLVGQHQAGAQLEPLLWNDGVGVVEYELVAVIYPGDVQVQVASELAGAGARQTARVGASGTYPAALLAGAVTKVARLADPGGARAARLGHATGLLVAAAQAAGRRAALVAAPDAAVAGRGRVVARRVVAGAR